MKDFFVRNQCAASPNETVILSRKYITKRFSLVNPKTVIHSIEVYQDTPETRIEVQGHTKLIVGAGPCVATYARLMLYENPAVADWYRNCWEL